MRLSTFASARTPSPDVISLAQVSVSVAVNTLFTVSINRQLMHSLSWLNRCAAVYADKFSPASLRYTRTQRQPVWSLGSTYEVLQTRPALSNWPKILESHGITSIDRSPSHLRRSQSLRQQFQLPSQFASPCLECVSLSRRTHSVR